MVGDLLIFVALFVLYRVLKRDGMVFWAWVFLYGAMRFGLSFLRDDDIVFAGLRMAQLIALGAMILAPLAVAYMPAAARALGPRGAAAPGPRASSRGPVVSRSAPAPQAELWKTSAPLHLC